MRCQLFLMFLCLAKASIYWSYFCCSLKIYTLKMFAEIYVFERKNDKYKILYYHSSYNFVCLYWFFLPQNVMFLMKLSRIIRLIYFNTFIDHVQAVKLKSLDFLYASYIALPYADILLPWRNYNFPYSKLTTSCQR